MEDISNGKDFILKYFLLMLCCHMATDNECNILLTIYELTCDNLFFLNPIQLYDVMW
jgi:hypothetical protein